MEELIPFLLLIAWMVINALAGAAKKKRQAAETASDGGAEPSEFQKALEELMREATGQPREPPPPPPPPPPTPMAASRPPRPSELTPSEHRRTASEHAWTPSEQRRTASEDAWTASEHAWTASEQRRTASEDVWTASEQRVTASEHLPGDAPVGRSTPLPPPPSVRHGRQTRFGAALLRDLRGPENLGRALVLREILGPPVSMRRPDER